MYKLFTNIDLVKDNWDQPEMSHFTKFYFLNTFFKHHKNFRHLFFISKNLRIYGQLFKFRIENINHYSNNKFVISLLKLFKINILYLSNSFFTNSPAFFSTKKIDLSKLLSLINDNYFMIVVPDHLMNAVKSESRNNYQKIEVEEDMFLDLDSNWKSFDDYLLNLKAKYRKKIKNILSKSVDITCKTLDVNDFNYHSQDIQKLFEQVVQKSNFRGPDFNTSTFLSLYKSKVIKIKGFFIDGRIEGFSTELDVDDMLYSYYVGFNKLLNKSSLIYGRILIETINSAIVLKKKKIIFGRTANEYKSNFGAVPSKSHIYVRVRNRFLHNLLLPFLKKIILPSWKQRSPFKNS